MSVCGDLTGRRRGQNVLNHVQPDLQLPLLFLEEVSWLNLRSSRRRSRRAAGGGAAGFRLAEGCRNPVGACWWCRLKTGQFLADFAGLQAAHAWLVP